MTNPTWPRGATLLYSYAPGTLRCEDLAVADINSNKVMLDSPSRPYASENPGKEPWFPRERGQFLGGESKVVSKRECPALKSPLPSAGTGLEGTGEPHLEIEQTYICRRLFCTLTVRGSRRREIPVFNQTCDTTVPLTEVRTEITKFVDIFRGHDQHDAQELLAFFC